MIWEWLFGQVAVTVEGLADHIDAGMPQVPPQVPAATGMVQMIVSAAEAAGPWFPIELIAPMLIFMVLAWVVGITIKIARIVASFMTLGGGGAG